MNVPLFPSQSQYDELFEYLNSARYLELEDRARSVLKRHPDSGFSWKMLGEAQRHLGKDNLQALQKSVELSPEDHEVHYNLSRFHFINENFAQALNCIIQSLRIKETAENKHAFVSCVSKPLNINSNLSYINANLIRALTEPWGNPSDLAQASSMLVRLDPAIKVCLNHIILKWPLQLSHQYLFQYVDILQIANNKLLLALIRVTTLWDIALERLLTTCRQLLLDTALLQQYSGVDNEIILDFYGALAGQCFINEYVFSQTAEEVQKTGILRNSLIKALDENTHIPSLWPLAMAAYIPLYSLPCSSRLVERQWPDAVKTVLTQQVINPEQEMQERTSIPRLNFIDDEVSKLVQNQYEENPFPRWIYIAPPVQVATIDAKIRQQFPSVLFKPLGDCPAPEVLIAGCGTGQHPILTAQRLLGVNILAVDLSMSSLSYAKRKTHEMGIASIEYAQGDIMKLGSLNRRFDLIESVGVLHHLADPWAGWRVLLSLLRPGGFMKIGLYSKLARLDITHARAFIADQGYGSSPDEIRRCRQDMMTITNDAAISRVSRSLDFFNTSNCRDLLFHVQEHQMTIPEIELFLQENNLAFLGFEVNQNVIQAYMRRFPDDSSVTNLSQWNIYETENPNTFVLMYNFWVQKAA
jgi:2-polyprenyl-3-methyl-5-hydroxy-6-metoxy-1,4-benzoquinol methylase